MRSMHGHRQICRERRTSQSSRVQAPRATDGLGGRHPLQPCTAWLYAWHTWVPGDCFLYPDSPTIDDHESFVPSLAPFAGQDESCFTYVSGACPTSISDLGLFSCAKVVGSKQVPVSQGARDTAPFRWGEFPSDFTRGGSPVSSLPFFLRLLPSCRPLGALLNEPLVEIGRRIRA